MFAIVPAAEEVGLVPDFIVNAGNIFLPGIAVNSGTDQLVPVVPIGGGGSVLAVGSHGGRGVGKGEQGSGSGT